MQEKHLWELINPSDPITFWATEEEAAFIADRMLAAPYFVKNATGEAPPDFPDLQTRYDGMWANRERLDSYAAAYASFVVGHRDERLLYDEAVSRMTPDETRAFRDAHHDRRRSSFNDICFECWQTADKISAYEAEGAV